MSQAGLPFSRFSGPRAILPRRPIPIDGGLRYVSNDGYPFLQPVLGRDGIEVCDFLYEFVEEDAVAGYVGPNGEKLDATIPHVRAISVENYFAVPGDSRKIKVIGTADVVRQIPATLENLFRLIKLPLIDEQTLIKAIDLIILWDQTLPYTCFASIMMKNATVPRFPEDGELGRPHRVPMETRKVEVTAYRKPTQDEATLIALGAMRVDDLLETTTTTETQVHKYSEKYQRYSKTKLLYSQQLIAAWSISKTKRIGLWMDMRTGKTAAAQVAAKEAVSDLKTASLVVIVCPVGNMYDPWYGEMLSEGWDVRVLDGTSEQDELDIMRATDYGRPECAADPICYIINYERVGLRLDMMKEHWDMSTIFIIADETSAIKNPDSRRTKATHELCRDAAYVVLLNGTPAEQGPQDFWAQERCIDPYGVVWDRSFSTFAWRWLEQYAASKFQVVSNKRFDFEMLISKCSIRYIRAEADQFSGRDKTFRHVELRPTEVVAKQTKDILAGFMQTIDEMGQTQEENMTACVLRTYGFLREVCCGYDKYREDEEGPYLRVRHDFDSKILWVQAYLMANPTQPLVIYVEFNEQEQHLKEVLDKMKIPWASTRPKMMEVWSDRLMESVPLHVWNAIREKYAEPSEVDAGLYKTYMTIMHNRDGLLPEEQEWIEQNEVAINHARKMIGAAESIRTVFVPMSAVVVCVPPWVRYNEDIIQFVKDGGGQESTRSWHRIVYYESYRTFKDRGPYASRVRAEQVERFNNGEAHVFILKWRQGRGIRLNRAEAVDAGRGTYPAIVSLAPPWSLGDWDQGQDRCVAVDKRTGKNVNTMIYSLSVKGTIEQKVLTALRSKKGVQAALLQDTDRAGFRSFVEDMIKDIDEAMASDNSGEDFFDAEDMNARILVGIPPYSKLTQTLIINKVKENKTLSSRVKYMTGKLTTDSIKEFFDRLPRVENSDIYNEDVELARAWDYIMEKAQS